MTRNDDAHPGPDAFGPGALLDADGEVIAGMVIETRPGQGPFVACRLESTPGLSIVGGDGDHRLAAVWSASSGRELERAVERLIHDDEDILGVYPTFIGLDEDDQHEAAERARHGIGTADRGDERP